MKKLFPLFLILAFLVLGLSANADVTVSKKAYLDQLSNVDPNGGTVIMNDDLERSYYMMSSPNSFISSDYKQDKPAYTGAKNVPDQNVILQGGDNCATATVISSLPYSDAGTTAGYTDDYDMACPYTGSTSPDVVYSYTPSSNVLVDIDVCESAYDTKLYVFDTNCTNADSVACNDDFCSNSSGDPYRSQLPSVPMNSGTTYYIVVDGYGGESGTYNINVDTVSAPPPDTLMDCPVGALFSQEPHLPADAWSAGTSDSGFQPENYAVFENFSASGEICDIHWWGLSLEYNAGWFDCVGEAMAFDIIFYPDAGGLPDTANPACIYTNVTPTMTNTGNLYSAYPLYKFDLVLNPCCNLTSGWVMIQGVSVGSPDCRFLWMSSPTGDADSYQRASGVLSLTGYDRALCLTGQYVPVFGACCDDATGNCADNVEMINCPTPPMRFAPNTLCIDMQPACGTVFGACCDDQGLCTQTSQQDCPGTWYPDTPCDPNPCPVPPPCSLVCVNPLEAEPDCYDDYVDLTNMGCNADTGQTPTFTAITAGASICGTAGNFLVGGTTQSRDTDWYRIVVPGDAMLTWSGVAEFELLLFIIDAGSEDCVDYQILDNASAPACSTVIVSVPVVAGVYYLWAGPAQFTGTACGSIYEATVDVGAAPTGACCVGGQCVATNTVSECAALQGDWYIGEDCSNFTCPLSCDNAIYQNGLPTGFARGAQCEPVYPFQAGVADDFILPGADSVNIAYVLSWFDHWNGNVNGPADYLGLNVTIYENNTTTTPPSPGGKPIDGDTTCAHTEIIPGGIVYTIELAPGSFSYANEGAAWKLTAPVDVDLAAGTTYWLEVEPIMLFADAGQAGWVNTDIVTGEFAQQIFELLGTDPWTTMDDSVDMAFCLIEGGGGGGGCDYVVGDVNGSTSYNGLDITYGVAFFKGGAAPLCDPNCPPCAGWNYCGDVNGSCSYNGLDITYGVAYFKGGAGPIPCADCPPSP